MKEEEERRRRGEEREAHEETRGKKTQNSNNKKNPYFPAVSVLKVEHVVVCGHHGCGAVAGALALGPAESSLVNLWVADIRDTRNLNLETLSALPPGPERVDRLVELNVVRQCFNVCTAPVVQAAWARGQKLAVHGLVYSLKDGLLRPLTDPVTGEFFGRGERSFFLSSFFFSRSRPPPLALSTSSSCSLDLLLSQDSPSSTLSLPSSPLLPPRRRRPPGPRRQRGRARVAPCDAPRPFEEEHGS